MPTFNLVTPSKQKRPWLGRQPGNYGVVCAHGAGKAELSASELLPIRIRVEIKDARGWGGGGGGLLTRDTGRETTNAGW